LESIDGDVVWPGKGRRITDRAKFSYQEQQVMVVEGHKQQNSKGRKEKKPRLASSVGEVQERPTATGSSTVGSI